MGLTISTFAENFKGQLRTAAHQAKEAQIAANGYQGTTGAQQLKWAADTIADAVVKATKYLDEVSRYYKR